MKYFGGCDVGSTYTKAVILDENGKICAEGSHADLQSSNPYYRDLLGIDHG